MANGIENHTVSLTKNGYQKLRDLIAKYPANEILNHIDEIRLDRTQGLKMLAGSELIGTVPAIWDNIRKLPADKRDALLMISVISSHKDLIRLFADNTDNTGKGTINRSGLETKLYTNLAYAMNELGLAVNFHQSGNGLKYDWNRFFGMDIGTLVKELLEHQLQNMGWRPPNKYDFFLRTFYEQAVYYKFHRVFGLTEKLFKDWLDNGSIVVAPGSNIQGSLLDTSTVPWNDFWFELEKGIRDSGLIMDTFLQKRFTIALLTKPFVILTGLAGSGKTNLAQAFSYWITEDDSQVCILPVGADWTNREPLLGYPNALDSGTYCKPDNGALDLLIEASKAENRDKPYFLILDEMNLSHVERYFADLLSVMESKDAIPLHEIKEDWKDTVPASIFLPENVFIIGTVNIDETTYMFSPKVLDRAQVIEFRVSEDEMAAFLDQRPRVDISRLKSKGSGFANGFVRKAALPVEPMPGDVAWSRTLKDFFKEMKPAGAEFGFRTAKDIFRYAVIMKDLTGGETAPVSLNRIIDVTILQKLLPKVHGSRRRIEPILESLAGLCLEDKAGANALLHSREPIDYADDDEIKYPLSLEKIVRMHRRVIQDGFTSFAEA